MSYWSEICQAKAQEQITKEEFSRLLKAKRSPLNTDLWRQLLSTFTLLAGVTFIVAGVLFLVAFNWSALGFATRISLATLTFVAAAATALVKGNTTLAGSASHVAAGLLVGPILAAYSQSYQLGADTHWLFALWLVALLPWAVTSKIHLPWLFGVFIATATFLTYVQTLPSSGDPAIVFVICAVAWAVAWALWETRSPPRIYPRILALGSFVVITSLATEAFDSHDPAFSNLLSVALLFIGVAACQLLYFRGARDLFMVAGSATALALFFSFSLLVNLGRHWDSFELFFLISALLVGFSIALASWVRLSLRSKP